MKPSSDTRGDAAEPSAHGKKYWASPRLVIYGDLRRLTLAKNRAGKDSSTSATSHYSL